MLKSTPQAGYQQQPSATPPLPQLGGMSGQAQQALQNRGYQLHLQESQNLGTQPLPYEAWAAQQG